MDKDIYAKDLQVGMEIVGFMDRTAKVVEVDDGRTGSEFTYFRVEDMPRDRMRRFQEVTIRVPEDEPEKMYLVCNLCGEAFDSIDTAAGHSDPSVHEDEFPEYRILPESEAM